MNTYTITSYHSSGPLSKTLEVADAETISVGVAGIAFKRGAGRFSHYLPPRYDLRVDPSPGTLAKVRAIFPTPKA